MESIDYQQECKELQNENENLMRNIRRWEDDYAKLKMEKKLLENHIKELEHKNLANASTRLYADSIVDGSLHHVSENPNEDTIYELHIQQTASFVVYANAYQRVAARPAFLDGCKKQILNVKGDIKIEQEGLAQRDADGKWKIVKDRELKLIIT